MLLIDDDWKAPFLWRCEFRSVLLLYVRKGLFKLPIAMTIVRNAERQLKGNEYLVHSDRVLELVSKSTLSVYDCEFVSLAQELDVMLIKADKKIVKHYVKTIVQLSYIYKD